VSNTAAAGILQHAVGVPVLIIAGDRNINIVVENTVASAVVANSSAKLKNLFLKK